MRSIFNIPNKSLFKVKIIVLALSLICSSIYAQDFTLKFASKEVIPEKGVSQKLGKPSAGEVFERKYLRIVQFNSIPDNQSKAALRDQGVELLNYIPNYAFAALIDVGTELNDMGKYGIRAVVTYEPSRLFYVDLSK